MVSWSEMPRSPGHVFYDRRGRLTFSGLTARMGALLATRALLPYALVGYFEGIDSERGLEWRCSDSLSLREFLLLEMRERVPDHSWLHGPARACPMKSTRRCLTGSWR